MEGAEEGESWGAGWRPRRETETARGEGAKTLCTGAQRLPCGPCWELGKGPVALSPCIHSQKLPTVLLVHTPGHLDSQPRPGDTG